MNTFTPLLPNTELTVLSFWEGFHIPYSCSTYICETVSWQSIVRFHLKIHLYWSHWVYIMKGYALPFLHPPEKKKEKCEQLRKIRSFQSYPIKQDDSVFCFAVVGLSDGDIHHVQGPHWEERCTPADWVGHEHGPEQVSGPAPGPEPQHSRDTSYWARGAVGHEHGPEQVSGPPGGLAPQHPHDITLGEGGCGPWAWSRTVSGPPPGPGPSAPTWHHTGRGGRWGESFSPDENKLKCSRSFLSLKPQGAAPQSWAIYSLFFIPLCMLNWLLPTFPILPILVKIYFVYNASLNLETGELKISLIKIILY